MGCVLVFTMNQGIPFPVFLRQLQVESPREIGANLEGKSGVFFWVL
jgi:hypothetical protein